MAKEQRPTTPETPATSSEAPDIKKDLDEWGGELLYFNGFINALGSGDVLIELKRNDKPVAFLNTSYTVAKTFAFKLNELVKTLETKSGNTIMTTDNVHSALEGKEKGNGSSDKPR